MADANTDSRKIRSASIDLTTIPAEVPLLALQGDVPLPMAVISAVVTAPQTLELLSRSDKSSAILWSIWSPTEVVPSEDDLDLPSVGVVVRHLSSRSLGSGGIRVDLEGLCRANLVGMVGVDRGIIVRIEPIGDPDGSFPGAEDKIRNCQKLLEELIRKSGKYPPICSNWSIWPKTMPAGSAIWWAEQCI
jgi:Lon protease-like protein